MRLEFQVGERKEGGRVRLLLEDDFLEPNFVTCPVSIHLLLLKYILKRIIKKKERKEGIIITLGNADI